jgi:hypothetical protein
MGKPMHACVRRHPPPAAADQGPEHVIQQHLHEAMGAAVSMQGLVECPVSVRRGRHGGRRAPRLNPGVPTGVFGLFFFLAHVGRADMIA